MIDKNFVVHELESYELSCLMGKYQGWGSCDTSKGCCSGSFEDMVASEEDTG